MASFSSGVFSPGYELILTVTDTGTSVSDNTSTLSWSLDLYSRSSYYFSLITFSYSAAIGGTSVLSGSRQLSVARNGSVNIGSGSLTVAHDADGTKTVSCSASIHTSSSIPRFTDASVSGDLALTTIPRASTFSVSNGTLGTAQTVTVNRASTAFTHRFIYRFNGGSWTTITTGIGTSYTWTPPLSWASYSPNASSFSVDLAVETYHGSTYIGSSSVKTITLTVPSSLKPSFGTVTVSEANTTVSQRFSSFVQKQSSLRVVTTGCSAQYGATVTGYRVTFERKTYNGSNVQTETVSGSGTISGTVRITDSRGNYQDKSFSVSVMAYAPPKITVFSAKRVNSVGQADDEGQYLSVSYSFAITPLGNQNTHSFKLSYSSGSGYTDFHSDGGYSGTQSGLRSFSGTLSLLSPDQSYKIRASAADWFTGASAYADVTTAKPLMDFHHSGTGMAVGKVAESGNLLDVAVPMLLQSPSAANDIQLRIKRSDTNRDLWVGIGTGGQNVGVYDKNAEKWMIYSDQNHVTHVDGMESLLSENGWQTLPGGLLLQWGKVSITPDAVDTVKTKAVTFPVSFPHGAFAAVITPNTSGAGSVHMTLTGLSQTGFTACLRRASSAGAGTTSGNWIAVGY